VLSGLDPEPRDDVFSFACVAYEMLTGRHPYERRSSIEARDAGAVPPRAWTLSANQWLSLLQALSLDREQRPADVRLLADVLYKEPQVAHEITVNKSDVPLAPPSTPLPDDFLPPQRGWGFFVFVAVALVMLIIAAHRNMDSERHAVAPPTVVTPAVPAPPQPQGAATSETSSTSHRTTAEAEKKSALVAPATTVQAPARKLSANGGRTPLVAEQSAPTGTIQADATTGGTMPAVSNRKESRSTFASEVGFASPHIVTSESSIAAVFILKRTGPLRDRAVVRWNAISGSAKNGEDFIAGSGGTVEFAPGQSQRAIYIPLRNDTVAEGDETFSVVITSAQRAKVGTIAKVEATIRDDD
jgi:Calx-beta domain